MVIERFINLSKEVDDGTVYVNIPLPIFWWLTVRVGITLRRIVY